MGNKLIKTLVIPKKYRKDVSSSYIQINQTLIAYIRAL